MINDWEWVEGRMTSAAAYKELTCEVNCKYGAPMGRIDFGVKDPEKRTYSRKIPLIYDGAYDKGGAYWGCGKELRVDYQIHYESVGPDSFRSRISYAEYYRK